MKKCPYCCEEIQDEAVKCRHCGEMLAGRPGGATPPIPPAARRLTRSRRDRMLAGVCGGLAAHLRMDPSLVRLLVALAILLSGIFVGIVAYVAAACILPEEE